MEGSTSPYAYVHGSPLEATDPSGMMDSYETRTQQELAGRTMTPAERTSHGNMCGLVNCDVVHVHDGSSRDEGRERWMLLTGGRSITVGNDIYVADQDIGADGYVTGETLAHELTHVGQYQQWGAFGYAADGIFIQSVNTVANWFGANNPVYPVPLPTSKRFGQMNMEQQATVVEGCYRRVSAYCNVQGQPYRF